MDNIVTIARKAAFNGMPHDGAYVDFFMTPYDTLYLAKYASEGNVYSFDGSGEAIDSTLAALESSFLDNASVISEDFTTGAGFIKYGVNGGICNLANKSVSSEEAVTTIARALEMLKNGGRIYVEYDKYDSILADFLTRLPNDKYETYSFSSLSDRGAAYVVEAKW